METRTVKCPNCSGPLTLPLGEVEAICSYCASRLRFLPGSEELEVVRTREDMKRKERVEVQRILMENRLREAESERWRQMAGKVAIQALPVVGDVAGKALFGAALERTKGCLGCGCVLLLGGLLAVLGLLGGVLRVP